jgi:GNAT superfamily N-acetyltransferase
MDDARGGDGDGARAGAPRTMIDPAHYEATETLRDRRPIEIRAQRPEDREGLRAAVARASSESLYRRFFSVKRTFSEKEAHYFLDIDFVSQVVAVADEGGRPTIIGGARYVLVQPGKAEVSFAVIDDYQAKGIGSALMRHLAAIGREARLSEFFAEVLSENVPMLKVFERSGLATTTKREGTIVHVTMRFE